MRTVDFQVCQKGRKLRIEMREFSNESDHCKNQRLVFKDDVEGMNDTGKPTQTSQDDVDEKVHIAASFKKDSNRRQDDG